MTDDDFAHVRAIQRRIRRHIERYATLARGECGDLDGEAKREHFEALILVGVGNLRELAGAPVAAATLRSLLAGLEDERPEPIAERRPVGATVN